MAECTKTQGITLRLTQEEAQFVRNLVGNCNKGGMVCSTLYSALAEILPDPTYNNEATPIDASLYGG